MEVESDQDDFAEILTEIVASELDSQTTSELTAEFEELLIEDISESSMDSRPPRLYLVGRSGAGKSSLINAHADGEVADVGAVEPTTAEADLFRVSFPGQQIKWDLVDSRGLFESVPADGDMSIETVAEIEADLLRYTPDFLLHILTPGQARAGANEFEAVKQLNTSITGGLPPRIVCLNKIDMHLSPGDAWPPEHNPGLSRHVRETLQLVADIHEVSISRPLLDDAPYRGVLFDSTDIIGAIPTYLKEQPYWNLFALGDLLCEQLQAENLLHRARRQCRQRRNRRLARKQTAAIAASVSNLPRDVVVNPDSPVLASYHRYLVALVGWFAGAPLAAGTADEYFDALSSLDSTASSLKDAVDGFTDAVFSVTGTDMENLRAQTYGIGRSAEVYFFNDELVAPREFREDRRGQRILSHISEF